MEPVRLQKYLARCGLGSRRACERLIDEGRVELNGRIVTEPGMNVKGTDTVRVDDRNVSPVDLRYFIVNKRTGVISVDRDHKERVYVVDLVPGGRDMGLFPVGRLDQDTTGLMVLTNDGEMANLIAPIAVGLAAGLANGFVFKADIYTDAWWAIIGLVVFGFVVGKLDEIFWT